MSNDRYSTRFPRNAYISLVLFLAAVVVLGILWLWRSWPRDDSGLDPQITPRVVAPRGDLAEDEKSTIAIFKQASPSVVHITTLRNSRLGVNLNVQQVPQGTGSGFVWDQDGHIVTNYHVIQNADGAHVTLADHSTWEGRLVGYYADKDLAVLRIGAPKNRLRPILIGASHDLQVGQKVFAIGNPFGLDRTLTTGVISAVGREIQSVTARPIKDVIQTDAAINPGNSGGPLLDSAGRLIGVNTMIVSPSGAFAGIGFAIPVDEVNRTVTQIIRHGKVVRPIIGVEVASEQLASELGLTGALVINVVPGSPAAKAGLQATRRTPDGKLQLGDVLHAVDDHPIKSVNELFEVLEKHKVGDTVTLTFLRKDREEKVQVSLSAAN